MKQPIESLFSHLAEAYKLNSKLIIFFSLPFLISFPLSYLLPNFVSAGGIFLRFASVSKDLGAGEMGLVILAFIISLMLASFAISAINIVVRSQRTLNGLNHNEIEHIEHSTFRLFTLFVLASLIIVASNLLLLEAYVNVGGSFIPLQPLVGSFIALIVSMAILFAPQAIAIDDASLSQILPHSLGVIKHKPFLFLFFLVFASIVLLGSDAFFLTYAGSSARILTLVANALLWVPLLEVLKTQIYLSKYQLI